MKYGNELWTLTKMDIVNIHPANIIRREVPAIGSGVYQAGLYMKWQDKKELKIWFVNWLYPRKQS